MGRTEDVTPVDMDFDVFPQVLAAFKDPALGRFEARMEHESACDLEPEEIARATLT